MNSNVLSIGKLAFYGCANLRNIHFPKTTDNLKVPKFYIASYNHIFSSCPNVGIFFTYGTNEQTTAVNAFKSYNSGQLTKWAQDFMVCNMDLIVFKQIICIVKLHYFKWFNYIIS
ncbi:MAG: hypothetical protein LBF00_00010 [Mycoplasmataceae bacterium]|nr:hypothetical protein [Mycoplasmataceae bacterium]